METTLECSFFNVDEDCKNPTIVTVRLAVAPKTPSGKIELRKLDWCFDYLADGTRAIPEPCGHTALEMMGDERDE